MPKQWLQWGLALAGLCLLAQGALAQDASPSYGRVAVLDQFRVKRVFFEVSGGSSSSSQPGAVSVSNHGDTEAVRLGFDAALPAAFEGGLSFRGAFSSGRGTFGLERMSERRWTFGPQAYLQHPIYGPLSLGVAGGYAWLTGKDVSNFGVFPGTNAMSEHSHETFWSIYAPVIVPVGRDWAFSATPSFGRTDAAVNFDGNFPPHQGSHLTSVNVLTAAAYGGVKDWVFELGTTTHVVVAQSQPRSTPQHSDVWTSPLIGATYFFAPQWALHGQVSTDVFDRWMNSVAALARIERHF